MRARTNPWFALISILTGGAIAVMASTAGCGSKTDDGNVTPADTGSLSLADSSVRDSAPVDTGSLVDSEKQYDVPGSLFDASIPDIQFEGGKSAGGCFACTTDKCKAEVTECDKDPKCRGLVLCGITDCVGNFSDVTCLLGCATKFDVELSATDETLIKAYSVGQCVQRECVAACPLPSDGGMMTTDTKSDSPSEAATDSAAEASAFMIYPGAAKSTPVDPEAVRRLQELFNTIGGNPEMRAHLINTFSTPR